MQSRKLQQLGVRDKLRVVGHCVDHLRDLAVNLEAMFALYTYYAVVEFGAQPIY